MVTLYPERDGLTPYPPRIATKKYDEPGGGLEYFTTQPIPFYPRSPTYCILN
jgi:hypothetical protein